MKRKPEPRPALRRLLIGAGLEANTIHYLCSHANACASRVRSDELSEADALASLGEAAATLSRAAERQALILRQLAAQFKIVTEPAQVFADSDDVMLREVDDHGN